MFTQLMRKPALLTAALATTTTSLSFTPSLAEERPQPNFSTAVGSSPSKTQTYYPYVILGAGTTAHAAIEAIRMNDPESSVLLISDEKCLPGLKQGRQHPLPVKLGDDFLSSYNEWRRHITSKLASESDVFRAQSTEGGGVSFLLKVDNPVIDKDKKLIKIDNYQEIRYEKCLLATAGNPRAFYVLGNSTKTGTSVNSLNAMNDFERLEGIIPELGRSSRPHTICVIGGGFLGTEIALGLAKRARAHKLRYPAAGKIKIQHIYAERAPLFSYLPRYLADDLKKRLARHGVEAVTDRLVTDLSVVEVEDGVDGSRGVDGGENREVVKMNLVGVNKAKIEADYVVLASSTISPNISIALKSGLELDKKNGGVVVNDHMEVGNGVYAAGVVASYYDPVLGRRRVNRYDHSVNTGLLAGFNMVSSNSAKSVASKGPDDGQQISYRHQPAVRSYLADINVSCESIGECNSDLETYGVWIQGNPTPESPSGGDDQEPSRQSGASGFMSEVSESSPYKRGCVYYLRNGKVVGVVLWNASDLLERARDVIRLKPGVSDAGKLKRRIPLAPDDWLKVVQVRAKEACKKMTVEDERESLVYMQEE